jgi:acyl-CoA thioesterase I
MILSVAYNDNIVGHLAVLPQIGFYFSCCGFRGISPPAIVYAVPEFIWECHPNEKWSAAIKLSPGPIITAMLVALTVMMAYVDAQAAMINIVAIGASNTLGWGVGPQNAYPEQLQAMLKAKGYDVHVTNTGMIANTTVGMLRQIDSTVPEGTQIVILQPGSNDLRFFGTKEQRTENIVAIESRLSARNIKVIVFDERLPAHFYQFDGIHFTTEGHGVIASHLLPKVISAFEPQNR